MKWGVYLIGGFIANVAGLYAAAHFIPDFTISPEIRDVLIAAGVLTAINIIIKPIIKLVLSPIIVLTLGIGMIAVNALTLYILTNLVPSITIGTLLAYVLGGLLISVINFILRKVL